MTLAYVVAYSAVEERSPSMTVLIDVAEARGAGRSREDIVALLRGSVTVEGRLEAMARDKMVESGEGSYRLTTKGCVWARVMSSWRSLMRLAHEGG